ncbi:MAG: ribulose-phosphate 3-epimerase [Candidatus Omnitrophica bacterium]|nr:ribulose-phosphate 3-epimerase [Candidatus Omnitrophota bacterium]
MLKASLSLWSADLSNLESEIKKSEPYADYYHLDVADGRYAETLLFFPDLVKAIRPHTQVPFEIHLICEEPGKWIEPFHEAGADRIIFYPGTPADPVRIVREIQTREMGVGVSLALGQGIEELDPYWDDLEMVVVLGTDVGVKGVVTVAEGTYEKIGALVEERERRGLDFEIEADGAIRKETVPLLANAGADVVVPGSLMFKNDMREIKEWMRGL